MEINKFDRVIAANQDIINQEVDSHPKTALKNLTISENSGEINQEILGLLAVADLTLFSSTTTQNNPNPRKWK